MAHRLLSLANTLFVGTTSSNRAPYDLAAEVARLNDFDRTANILGEILGDLGVKRDETRRAGGLLLTGLLLAHLPEFKLPPKREEV